MADPANPPTSVWRRGAAAHDPEHYLSRELSWLAFNRRVLEEAESERHPLLERAKFLAIVGSNLDEFVMVRVAELHAAAHGRASQVVQIARGEARAQLARVREAQRALVADQYRCWGAQVAPALAREGFALVLPAAWEPVDRETLRKFYIEQIEPALTPLAVDPARPFPLIANRGISVAVRLEPEAGGEARNALVAVPAGRRLIGLVSEPGRHALIEDVVLSFLDGLFPGYRITARCLFRPTRDGSLEIDEDQAQDLLAEIEQELASRAHGHAVRLEVEAAGDPGLRQWLAKALDLADEDVVPVDGPLDLTFLHGVGDRLDALPRGPRTELRDPPLPVLLHPPASEWEDPFSRIRQDEILLHHPFQSFQRVVELVERAAEDPRVLAIKQTLYRTSGNSPIVRALMRAARSGKQVTVLVELKARFDEAANIKWARALEEAGVHVVYGLVGFKVHAKLLMVIRRDEDQLRRYCHIGTGNYNERTARLYTDLGYITANEAVGRDVAALFNMLTGYSRPPEWERLLVAPLTMRSGTVAWIRREIAHARAGRPARITAKFNSLVDEAMCDELYAASRAGVDIDLIVRGMCILRPGVPGLSERIRVRSLVGRLLEHSRIYRFENAGAPVYTIASADWMTRNLDRRVECLVSITDAGLRRRLQEILDACLADTVAARELQPDGSYRRVLPPPGAAGPGMLEALIAQTAALDAAAGAGSGGRAAVRFRPRRKGG